MQIEMPAAWPRDEAEALAEQERLRGGVRTEGEMGDPRWIAGVDVAYANGSPLVAAAVVVLDAATLKPVEQRTAVGTARFPYIPGLLAFRELPTLLEALRLLERTPDVFVCDGYGIAHPRRFGLASHLGVLTGRPSLGVGKTAFIGRHDEPGGRRGSHADLVDEGRDGHPEVIGRVLRTQDATKPVYVSVGHAVALDAASDLVLRLAPRYRLPETTRAADRLSRVALGRAEALGQASGAAAG
ncbi:MAG TPA: endonuclease V [Actinocrinis sp.]|jgi:deoxyribonuclease V